MAAHSKFLSSLSQKERDELIRELHKIQHGKCFISEKTIDLALHYDELEIDHVIPLANKGKDEKSNLALTFRSANRSKQASDLNLARLCYRFKQLSDKIGKSPNLSDILHLYGGASHKLPFQIDDNCIRFSFAKIGKDEIVSTPVYEDKLSSEKYFFAKLPIQYLHHDEDINPRPISSNIYKLLEEFYKGNPQLHISLGYIETYNANECEVKLFDGQHKAAAQIMLGAKEIPVRIFINPHKDKIRKTNLRAGTTLKQVAFDISIQRQFGNKLYWDTIERYQKATGKNADDFSFSERTLATFFRSESREIKKYILDAVKIGGIQENPDNRLWQFVCDNGQSSRFPLSFATIERTFFSLFIGKDLLETNINHKIDEERNPRELEAKQITRLMNIIADAILIDNFDKEIGTYQIESRIKKGEAINLDHLRACRMMKEEILHEWLDRLAESMRIYFNFTSARIFKEKDPLFQEQIPEQLWANIETFVRNLADLPLWKNTELQIFSSKENYDSWRYIFNTGKARSGEIILAEPLNINTLILPKK